MAGREPAPGFRTATWRVDRSEAVPSPPPPRPVPRHSCITELVVVEDLSLIEFVLLKMLEMAAAETAVPEELVVQPVSQDVPPTATPRPSDEGVSDDSRDSEAEKVAADRAAALQQEIAHGLALRRQPTSPRSSLPVVLFVADSAEDAAFWFMVFARRIAILSGLAASGRPVAPGASFSLRTAFEHGAISRRMTRPFDDKELFRNECCPAGKPTIVFTTAALVLQSDLQPLRWTRHVLFASVFSLHMIGERNIPPADAPSAPAPASGPSFPDTTAADEAPDGSGGHRRSVHCLFSLQGDGFPAFMMPEQFCVSTNSYFHRSVPAHASFVSVDVVFRQWTVEWEKNALAMLYSRSAELEMVLHAQFGVRLTGRIGSPHYDQGLRILLSDADDKCQLRGSPPRPELACLVDCMLVLSLLSRCLPFLDLDRSRKLLGLKREQLRQRCKSRMLLLSGFHADVLLGPPALLVARLSDAVLADDLLPPVGPDGGLDVVPPSLFRLKKLVEQVLAEAALDRGPVTGAAGMGLPPGSTTVPAQRTAITRTLLFVTADEQLRQLVRDVIIPSLGTRLEEMGCAVEIQLLHLFKGEFYQGLRVKRDRTHVFFCGTGLSYEQMMPFVQHLEQQMHEDFPGNTKRLHLVFLVEAHLRNAQAGRAASALAQMAAAALAVSVDESRLEECRMQRLEFLLDLVTHASSRLDFSSLSTNSLNIAAVAGSAARPLDAAVSMLSVPPMGPVSSAAAPAPVLHPPHASVPGLWTVGSLPATGAVAGVGAGAAISSAAVIVPPPQPSVPFSAVKSEEDVSRPAQRGDAGAFAMPGAAERASGSSTAEPTAVVVYSSLPEPLTMGPYDEDKEAIVEFLVDLCIIDERQEEAIRAAIGPKSILFLLESLLFRGSEHRDRPRFEVVDFRQENGKMPSFDMVGSWDTHHFFGLLESKVLRASKKADGEAATSWLMLKQMAQYVRAHHVPSAKKRRLVYGERSVYSS